MKCDDVLMSLETGGPLKRVLAQRHVRRCPGCQRAVERLGEFKRDLRDHPPLAESSRAVWMAAAGDRVPMPVSIGWALRGGLAALAAVVLFAATVFWFSRDAGRARTVDSDYPAPRLDDPDSAVTDLADSPALDVLSHTLADLSRELDELVHTVSLIDERRELEILLSRDAAESQ